MATTYSSDNDVKALLGTLAQRLPEFVDIDIYRQMSRATITDKLALIYPDAIPVFSGVGLEAVKWIEARYAAADILDAIRVNVDSVGDAPERLRALADRAMEGGIVGYPPGSTTVDDGDGTQIPVSRNPRVSSFTPVSAFPDPYDAARGQGLEYL